MEGLRIVPACTEEHFRAMSLIHALGWRDTYRGYVPDEYMRREITDERWVPVFRENHAQGVYHGLLLYRGGVPVSCINYGPARVMDYKPGEICVFDNSAYAGWGEVTSFYTHPAERGRGYGGLLFEEALDRLRTSGFQKAFVFVLRENEKARRFYAAHGFAWDGTTARIPFPPDGLCVDLRYTAALIKENGKPDSAE